MSLAVGETHGNGVARWFPNHEGVEWCLARSRCSADCFVGPNGVRPRASASGPYTFGCGSAASRYVSLGEG